MEISFVNFYPVFWYNKKRNDNSEIYNNIVDDSNFGFYLRSSSSSFFNVRRMKNQFICRRVSPKQTTQTTLNASQRIDVGISK